MASSFKAVQDTMEDLNIVVWKVLGRGGSLMGYQNDSKHDLDGSISRLKKLLVEQSGDVVRVELHPLERKTAKGGDMMKVIKMDVDLNSIRGTVAGIPIQNDSKDLQQMIKQLTDQNMKLQAELIEAKYTNKITELEKKIEGINDGDPMNKLLEGLLPVLAAYLPSLMKAPAAPSQTPSINGLPPMMDLVSEWTAVDPEAGKVLAAVVNLAVNHSAIYQSAKPSLMQYYEQ